MHKDKNSPKRSFTFIYRSESSIFRFVALFGGLAFLLCALQVQAQEQALTSQEKNQFYNSCMRECLPSQRKLPENKSVLDVPFVLESYCACHCTRMAMRLPRKHVELLGRIALEGGNPAANPQIKPYLEKNQQVCIGALTAN